MMWYDKTALVIAAIGAINWGLYALDWDLVDKAVGETSTLAKVVYWVIALCGVWALIQAFK